MGLLFLRWLTPDAEKFWEVSILSPGPFLCSPTFSVASHDLLPFRLTGRKLDIRAKFPPSFYRDIRSSLSGCMEALSLSTWGNGQGWTSELSEGSLQKSSPNFPKSLWFFKRWGLWTPYLTSLTLTLELTKLDTISHRILVETNTGSVLF